MKTEIISYLEATPILAGLNVATLKELAESATVSAYNNGDILFKIGEAGTTPFVVIDGCIALSSRSEGEGIILSLLSPSDTLGLVFALDQIIDGVSVHSIRPSRVLWLSRKSVLSLIASNAAVAHALTEQLFVRLREAYLKLRVLSNDRAEVRVARALLMAAPIFSHPSANGTKVRIEISRKELSRFAGLTLETTVRVLRKLAERNLVDLSLRRLISINELEDLVCFIEEARAAES